LAKGTQQKSWWAPEAQAITDALVALLDEELEEEVNRDGKTERVKITRARVIARELVDQAITAKPLPTQRRKSWTGRGQGSRAADGRE
jgi:hypothetical protein